ncbi:hypothetical protein [Xenorhabdus griffiniae]|uniref:Phage protein n=1 Tax=Xenorhabdus griffiniae TaxID=351672 RepID=A0ABY9XEU7_9GAMM|nr:hypothetical protein [Xenorhabdus griffiniae]MBD1225997.1 hypothetical protein [Xenorhabdus griffiniae]MBE8585885.1 hypothetical protein [Xenorhabdus griffiniae]WMV71429.1 hypothetical protein QL128_14810 [Xenorhabdus griffiniae]WNH01106.1 hypothetical protein QL112_014815 [Xenorhabdus griffiniae]
MAVSLVDKKTNQLTIGLPNGVWYEILDIQEMEQFIDNRHFCDSAEGSAEIARKIADLIEACTLLDKLGSGRLMLTHRIDLKNLIIDFFRTCDGFYTR